MNKKLFILAEARSGSSWLMQTLDSHEDITLLPELLNHVSYPEAAAFHQAQAGDFSKIVTYIEQALTQIPQPRYCGFKILLNQFEYISPDFSRYFIDSYKESFFIFLYRQNMVLSQVSLRQAHTSGKWHYKHDEKIEKQTVTIEPKQLYKNLEKQKILRQKICRQLKELSVQKIDLVYETLFNNKEKSIKGICDFLDIPYKRQITFSPEQKGNPFKPFEIIKNYDEVRDFLKQYPEYYKMLLQETRI